MHTVSRLHCFLMRKGFTHFLAPFLLTLLAVAIIGPHAYACTNVDVTIHSDDNTKQTNYVLLRYKALDGSTKFSACQSLPYQNWQDLQIQAALDQNINLNYYYSSSCDISSEFLAVTLPVPSQTNVAGCWFNPDNVTTPNWSGCVNPSQTLSWTTSGFSPA